MTEYREARPEDLGSILELCWEMHSETDYSKFELDRGRAAEFVGRMMESGYAGIAVDGGEVIGVLLGGVMPFWFSSQLQGCEVLFYVRGSARGGFVGKRMVEGFKAWCELRGAVRTVLALSSGGDIDRKGRFLERIGFEPIGGLYAKDMV